MRITIFVLYTSTSIVTADLMDHGTGVIITDRIDTCMVIPTPIRVTSTRSQSLLHGCFNRDHALVL
jgi:hypothetical protein